MLKRYSHALLFICMLMVLLLSAASGSAGAPEETNDTGAAKQADLRIVKSPNTQTVLKGGTAVFTVVVLNASTKVDLVDVRVTDPATPDCDREIGNLPADSNFPPYQCTLRNVQEPFTNEITVTGKDARNEKETSASDAASVEVLDLSVEVVATPDTLPEPGGLVSFDVEVTNLSSVPVTLSALSSAQYGDLTAANNPRVSSNTCARQEGLPPLAAAETFSCSFEAAVEAQPSEFSVVVTAVAVDDAGNSVSGNGIAVVEIIDAPAQLTVDVVAQPDQIAAPGGSVTLSVAVRNESDGDTISLTGLRDGAGNSLAGRGSCNVPQQIGPGATYTCQFSEQVEGQAGEERRFVVRAVGLDDDVPPQEISASGEAVVRITRPAAYVLYQPIVADDLDEPNTCADPYPLALNRLYTFLVDDVGDWYSFTLLQPATVTVTVSNFVTQGQVLVYRGESCADLEELGQNGDIGPTKVLPLGSQPAGNYLVRVGNDPQDMPVPYQLIVEAR